MLFGAFFTAVIISREQDVRLQRGHHKGGAAMVDAVAPLFTSDLGSCSWKGDPAPFRPEILSSPKTLYVSKGLRVIVFAPHPDDETLGAGGLLQRVVQNGGTARVVFMTNGDGYKEAIKGWDGSRVASAEDFLEYGMMRQEEAIRAMGELGLEPQDAVFLGFPDDGIDELWASHWSSLNPYTSPYTQVSGPPYDRAFNRWVKYAGKDLEDAIRAILVEFAPDWIVIPDPRDQHPDHACTSVFVLDALRGLDQSGALSFHRTHVFTYLVHYVGYPNSQRWLRTIRKAGVGGSLYSANILAPTRWFGLTLTQEELRRKRNAIAAHRSQFEILGGFFEQYIKPAEVFGRLEPVQVFEVPQDYASRFNRPSS